MKLDGTFSSNISFAKLLKNASPKSLPVQRHINLVSFPNLFFSQPQATVEDTLCILLGHLQYILI